MAATITLSPVRRANDSDVAAMEEIVSQWNADYSTPEAGEGPASTSYHLTRWYTGYQMVCVNVGKSLADSYTWSECFQRCSGCGTIQINMEGENCNHCDKPHR